MKYSLDGKDINLVKSKDQIIEYLDSLNDGELISSKVMAEYTGYTRTDLIKEKLGDDADKYVAKYKRLCVYGNPRTIKALTQ